MNSLFAPEEDKFLENDFNEQSLLSKTILLNPSGFHFEALIQQLKQRIEENQGECIYSVGECDVNAESGLSDNELEASKNTLVNLAKAINCECTLLRKRTASLGHIEDYLIRQCCGDEDFLEVKVAVVGNVDSGKSTLLGVLTYGELDNGRGLSRQKLFRHKHEIETGRTSSVGNEILGFRSDGTIVNRPVTHTGNLNWEVICRQSFKVLSFIDLAGHEKYLKTTVFGMTSHIPDFCMLMIGSNAGVVGTTKEHLGLALALNVPVFVVVTKIDMCPPNVLKETMHLLLKTLKSPGCRKIPVLVSCLDDAIVTATNFTSERICPIFHVSNVTGKNINLLKSFLNLLNSRAKCNDENFPEFLIDDSFSVPGVGTVVSGTVVNGVIHAGESLLLGPDMLGNFELVQIKSIHRRRLPVQLVKAGHSAAFALRKVKRANIRKGMVLVDTKCNPKAVWEYKGEVLVLHHPTTITSKYQAMVHCGGIRQTASILNMNKQYLRTGDKAIARFRFIKNPEYLKSGTKFVFREGKTKLVGTVTELIEDAPAYQTHLRKPSQYTRSKLTGIKTADSIRTSARRRERPWTNRNQIEKIQVTSKA